MKKLFFIVSVMIIGLFVGQNVCAATQKVTSINDMFVLYFQQMKTDKDLPKHNEISQNIADENVFWVKAYDQCSEIINQNLSSRFNIESIRKSEPMVIFLNQRYIYMVSVLVTDKMTHAQYHVTCGKAVFFKTGDKYVFDGDDIKKISFQHGPMSVLDVSDIGAT